MEFEPTYSTPNFSSHEADAALQYVSDATDSGTHESQLRSIEIAKPDIYAVASPAFVAGIKSLDAPADLLRVPLVHETSVAQWERWFIAQGIVPQIAREDRWQDHTIEEFRIWLQQEVSTTLNLAGRKP